ncbi:MAG: hypothetical protein PHI87_03595 [Candidatus Methanomethylophilus sp.]|nr:hypothetical protein [Methanomethylophilus sp.]
MTNLFKKVFKSKKLIVFLVLGIAGIFLFPQLAHADALGIMDVFSQQLDALDFADNSFKTWMAFFVMALGVSMAWLDWGANFLDWSMVLDANLNSTLLVTSGWQIISALANLVIVVSFIWTGLSMVIKGDSAEGQSSLLRLIMLALVVNFSLFFMGALVDIAGFVQGGVENIFLGTDISSGLASDAIIMLYGYSIAALASVGGTVLVETFTALIPVANVAAVVASTVLFVVMAAISIPVTLLTILVNISMGTMFFYLGGIFVIRIMVLWILAILAPLAVVTYKTEIPILNKFYDEWMKTLFEWLFVGVIYVFFLGLGFKLLATNTLGLFSGKIAFPDFFIQYIVLFLYLLVVCHLLSKKWAPKMMQDGIKVAKDIGGTALKFISPMIKNGAVRSAMRLDRRDAEKLADGGAMSKGDFDTKWDQEANGGGDRLIGESARWFNRVSGKPEGTLARNLQAEISKASKGMEGITAEQLMDSHSVSDATRAGMIMAASDSQLNKCFDSSRGNPQIIDPLIKSIKLLSHDKQERVFRTMLSGNDVSDDELLKQSGFSFANTGVGSGVKKVVLDASGDDIAQINIKALKSKTVLNTLLESKTSAEFGILGKKKGKEFIDAMNKELSPDKIKTLETKNLPIYKYVSGGTSPYGPRVDNSTKEKTNAKILQTQGEIMREVGDLGKKNQEVSEKIDDMLKKQNKKPEQNPKNWGDN